MAYKKRVKQNTKRRQAVRFNLDYNKSMWLTNSEEIKKYREDNLPEDKLCPILKIETDRWCLDHNHKTGHTREVISQAANSFEGFVNKAFQKYCSKHTELSISEVLKNLADYYQKDYTENPLHHKIIDDLKNRLMRFKKSTIISKLDKEFNTNTLYGSEEITEENSLQKDLVELYLNLYIKDLEGKKK
jgi:hypothetical protein